MFKGFRPVIVLTSLLILFGAVSFGLARAQDAEQWARAVPISGALSGSWYPSLAAEDSGTVHAIWGVTQRDNTLYYRKYDGLAWSRPIDILIGGPRSVLMLDGRNLLHLLYSNGPNVVVTDADAARADSSAGWNAALQLNRAQGALSGDLRVDEQGILHAVWLEKRERCEGCYLAVYGQSTDSGQTWSLYRVLSDAGVLARPIQLVRAPNGIMFAQWGTEAIEGKPEGLALSVSANNGETWLDDPIVLRDEKEAIRQPALSFDANGALVLIHNLGVKDETFFQTSSDQGVTWSERQPIPGLFAAKTATGNDYFAVAHDSANALHLIAIGRKAKDQDLEAVYHLKWDGQSWSAPAIVYEGDQFLELPALAIANGNRLHVLFSARDRYRIGGPPDSSYQVWYTNLLTDAAQATRVPLPTLTLTPTATPTLALSPTITRRPTNTPAIDTSTPTSPVDTSNVNPQFPIIAGVVPVVAILVIIALINFVLRRRR